jgi:hypothetical protein
MNIAAYLYNPFNFIWGGITLFLCSLTLHLLIRKPILNWVEKMTKGKEGRARGKQG